MDEERIRKIVREEMREVFHSDKFHFNRDMQIANGRNIEVGTSVGTMIGTETTQKLGFFGATPTTRQSLSFMSTVGSDTDGLARGEINNIMNALKNLGLFDAS